VVDTWPYEAFFEFFSKWFGNGIFITFAFLAWAAITVHCLIVFREKKWWLKWPLVFVISGVHYLVFGLLVAPGSSGGAAEFLYDPAIIRENMLEHGGLLAILLWPGHFVEARWAAIMMPVGFLGLLAILGWGFWKLRKHKENG
jgi:hypothetical protein